MQQHFFSFESGELQKKKPATSSHCSSVQERLVNYGPEALNSLEHLGLIVGSQLKAEALLQHFGSLAVLARASVQELLPFLSRTKALRLMSSLRMSAVFSVYEIHPLSKGRALSIYTAKARSRTASCPEGERPISFVSRTFKTSNR